MDSVKYFEVTFMTIFLLGSFGLEKSLRTNAWQLLIGLAVLVFGITLGWMINFGFSYEILRKILSLAIWGRKYTLVHVTVLFGYGVILSSLLGVVYGLYSKLRRI